MRLYKNTRLQGERSFLKASVKGGALYISVIVSCVVAVLLSLLLVLSRHNQQHVSSLMSLVQLQYHLQSGLQMAMSSFFNEGMNRQWLGSGESQDSVRISKLPWGAYIVITAESKNRHQYLSQAGLYGAYLPADTGLLVSDNSRPTGVSGNVIFKADCYLPRAGIKPAYIEGQSYSAGADNASHLKSSPVQFPKADKAIAGNIQGQFDFDSARDSLLLALPENFNRSFHLRTTVYQGSKTQLQRVKLSNNIKLVCEEVLVDSSARLENVLLVCKHARFKSGFKGSVHVIAEDSISMEENCQFSYPSSFVLAPRPGSPSEGLKYIAFNKDCRFFGGVLALPDAERGTGAKVLVKLHPKSEVNGLVYSGSYLHLEGKVNATCIADKLLIHTNSAVYENHLLGCEVNPRLYSGLLAVPLLFNTRDKLVCCNSVR